jgi:putative alpha-1,2-mannosidase
MKKVMFALATLMLGTISYGQKVNQADVPTVVKQAFEKKFARVKEVKWEKEDGKFEVNFEQNKHEMSAVFNASGVLEETEAEIKMNELPSAVTTYIAKNYSSSKVKEAAKITKANGEVNYEAEVNGSDLIFDANGKFIRLIKE